VRRDRVRPFVGLRRRILYVARRRLVERRIRSFVVIVIITIVGVAW